MTPSRLKLRVNIQFLRKPAVQFFLESQRSEVIQGKNVDRKVMASFSELKKTLGHCIYNNCMEKSVFFDQTIYQTSAICDYAGMAVDTN